MSSIESSEIQSKVEEYSKFVDEVLRPDLIALEAAELETEHEIRDYSNLRRDLQDLRITKTASFNPSVDLGHQVVFCEGSVDDTSKLFVHVGMGFHAELTLDEAASFCEKRSAFLREVLSYRREKTQTVRTHLDSSLLILDELHGELVE